MYASTDKFQVVYNAKNQQHFKVTKTSLLTQGEKKRAYIITNLL